MSDKWQIKKIRHALLLHDTLTAIGYKLPNPAVKIGGIVLSISQKLTIPDECLKRLNIVIMIKT